MHYEKLESLESPGIAKKKYLFFKSNVKLSFFNYFENHKNLLKNSENYGQPSAGLSRGFLLRMCLLHKRRHILLCEFFLSK